MEKFSFFNDINDDRVYYAEDFARHLKKYFTNGIFNNELQVVANNNMSITIKEGDANIEGYRYTNTGDLIKTIETADGTLKRIDNVVIRLDLTNRLISAQIIKGDFSDNPLPPALIRSSVIYDIKLAEIYVDANITSITQSDITDTRFNASLCGNVTQAVLSLDTSDIFAQYESAWNAWFSNIQTQLSGDVAGNLQNEVNAINNNILNMNIALGLNTDTYDTNATYAVGDLVIHNNAVYECRNEITTAEEWTESNWTLVPIIVQ